MFTGGYTAVGKTGAKSVSAGEIPARGQVIPAAPALYAYPLILLNFL